MAKKLITLTEEDKEQLRKGNAAVKANSAITVGSAGTIVPALPKVDYTPKATTGNVIKHGVSSAGNQIGSSLLQTLGAFMHMSFEDTARYNAARTGNDMWLNMDTSANDAIADSWAQRRIATAQKAAEKQGAINEKYDAQNFTEGQRWASDAINATGTVLPALIPGVGNIYLLGLGFGAGTNQALNEGASLEDASDFGILSAGKEWGTEKLFGGLPGMKTLFNPIKRVTSKVSNPVVRTAVDLAGRAGQEAVEEGIATYIEPELQRMTYNPDAEDATLKEILYNMSLGAVASGAINAGVAGTNATFNAGQNVAQKIQPMIVNNQNQRADDALFGDTSKIQEISAQNLQKNMQKNANASEKPQNASESAKGASTTEKPTYVENIAQNQTSKADFSQVQPETVISPKMEQVQPNQTLNEPTQTIKPTLAPDERNMQNVASRKVKAMQQEDPSLKPYIQDMAQQLLDELNTGVPGGVEVGIDPETRNVTTKRGHKSVDSEIIAEMKKAGMSTGEIRKGLELLIQDGGVENVATAKRAELFAYKALTEGYNSIVGGRVNPNYEFAYRNMTDEDLTAEEGRINDSFVADDDAGNKELIARLEAIDNMKANRDKMSQVEQVSEQVSEEVKLESEEVKSTLEDYDASQLEKEVYDFFNEIGDKFGMNVRLVKGMNKKRVGMYKDGFVYLNADRMTDYDTIRFTTVHEFLHSLKGTREYEEFQELALRYLRSLTGRSDVTDMDLVNYIVEKRAEEGEPIRSEEEAYDELTALFAEMIFDDPATINEICLKEPSIAEKVLNYIKGKIRDLKAKKGMSKAEKQQYDMLQKARKLYVKGLRKKQAMRELDADLESSGVITNENGEVIAEQENGEVRFNIATYENGGRANLLKFLNKMTARDMLSEQDAQDIVEELDFAHEQLKDLTQGEKAEQYKYFTSWSQAQPMFDEDGNPVLSVVTKNGDYNMNLDFSTRCTKRVPVDRLLQHLATSGKFDIGKLQPTDFARINEILAENGLTTACKMCFVESKRDRSGQWATTIADEYNELLTAANIQNGVVDEKALKAKAEEMRKREGKKGATSMHDNYAKFILDNPDKARPIEASELMYSEGMAKIKAEMPEIYGIAARRSGAGTPKPLMPEAVYTNDLITDAKSKDSKGNPMTWSPEAAFDVGGVRFQSFSDYRDNMIFDYLQMFSELATRKMPAHGYSKVESFVRLFGMTGAKINMSLIPVGTGLDENGNYMWDAESFDFDTALEIQRDKRYSNNVGICAVGASDAHIWKLLDDKDIRYIIPYHRSGVNPEVAKMKGIDTSADYTPFQENKIATKSAIKSEDENWVEYYSRLGSQGSNLKSLDKNNDFSFDFYGDLMETFDAVETSQNYIKACQDAGVVPKFPQFIYRPDGTFNESYYKFLTDFTLYNEDGKFCPQKAVKFGKNNMPEEWLDIVKSGLQAQQATQDNLDATIADVADQVIQAISGDTRLSTGHSSYQERVDEIKNIKHSTKMSDFYTNTVKNSDLFTQAEKNLILSTVATEQDVVTEKESLQQAAESIARDHDGSKVRLLGDGLRDGVDVDMAMYFLQESADHARSTGDYTEFKRWVKRIQTDTTDSARLLQSLDKYSRTTPEGIVMQAQRFVKKTEEQMSVNKIGKTKFTPGKEFDSGKMRRIKNETKQVQDAIKDSEQMACKTAKNALRRVKKDLDINLHEIIKKGAGDKQAIADSISKYILEHSTLEKAEAEKLAQETVDLYYKELSRIAEEKLNAMFKEQPKTKLDKKKKETWFEEVMGLINMGAYDDADIVDAIKQKNGLPVLTNEDIATIYDNVEKANQYKRNSYEWRMYMAKAQQVALNKMPENQKKRLTQFKRLMMMSNVATHTRNFGGNVLLPGAEAISNLGAVPADIIASKVRGSQRTTHINPQLGAYAKGFAKGVSETAKDIKHGVNTYRMGDDVTTQAELPKGDTFKNPWMHGIEKVINYGLMFGDRPFFEAAYNKRLAELEKLNYDMSSELTKNEAYEYALNMVYQNDSHLSKSAKGIQTALNDFLTIGGFALGDWVLPFTQTPANIADKILDYSPVGFFKAMEQIAKSETQPFDQRLFSQRIGRSLTGTTIMILGWTLAKSGDITGGDDDDYELRNAKTKAGQKSYSFKIGDTYYDYSWAQPIAVLLAMGADMYYEGHDKKEDLNDFFDMAYAGVRSGANCFFNMSFLQSIFDFFGGYSTNFDNIAAGLTSFPTQLAPALGNAVNKTIDPYQRETYDPNPLKQNANKVMARLPGASQLLPVKLDAYGEPMMQNQGRDAFSRTMENVVSPVKIAQENPHLVNDELLRLHEMTGLKSQFLSNPDKTISFGDGDEVELSTREYQQCQTISNKFASAQMQKLITSDAYRGMDDSTRVKVLANIESYAKYKAKKQIATAHDIEYSVAEYEKVADSGVEAWQYYATKTRFGGKWSDYDDVQKYVWTAERIGMNDNDFVKHYTAMSAIKGDGQKSKRIDYLYNQWANGKITQEQYWYLRMEFAGNPSKSDISQCPYDWIITSTTK